MELRLYYLELVIFIIEPALELGKPFVYITVKSSLKLTIRGMKKWYCIFMVVWKLT